MTAGTGWVEVAERCFVRRYVEWDVNVGVVLGAAGALVVDTRATGRQGELLRADIRPLAPRAEVRWVVNTHQHFDHTFGNGAFEGATVIAHENAAAGMVAAGERVKALVRADPELDPDHPELSAEVMADLLATEIRQPDRTFSSARQIDLGDRLVELVYPGRGHTDGDLLLRVPDVDVVLVGDLVEESAPPSFGVDCFPLDWPASLDLVLGLLTARSVVVPGHGRPVDRDFVADQRTDIGDVAGIIRSLVQGGVALDDAASAGAKVPRTVPLVPGEADRGATGWPYPPELLVDAVRRGYAQLGLPVAATH